MAGFQTTSTIYSASLGGVPSGVSAGTSATPLVAITITENVMFPLAKVGIVGVVKATAFDAMIAAVDAAVQNLIDVTWATDILTADVDYIAEVYAYSDFSSLQNSDEIWLDDANNSFYIEVSLRVRIY